MFVFRDLVAGGTTCKVIDPVPFRVPLTETGSVPLAMVLLILNGTESAIGLSR